MSDIDPRDFGALEAKVEQMEKALADQSKKIDQLLELANHGKGALWTMMAVSGVVGALVAKVPGWIVDRLGA
jgi:uncharacterized protein (UPF0548 family)